MEGGKMEMWIIGGKRTIKSLGLYNNLSTRLDP